jgi:hypothetical protein
MAQGLGTLLSNTNKVYKIQIYSFSNGSFSGATPTIEFPAFITDFTDSFKSDWKKESVYGRMDPISIFKSTTRNISISFDIPNESVQVAKDNMRNIDFLIRGLYPVYTNGALGTRVISSPPMFRVKFANLISNVTATGDDVTLRTGLLCYIPSFDFKPKVDSGFFIEGATILPKLVSATLNLEIVHEHSLGNQIDSSGKLVPRVNIVSGSYPHNVPNDPPPQRIEPSTSTTTQATTTTQDAQQGAAEAKITA